MVKTQDTNQLNGAKKESATVTKKTKVLSLPKPIDEEEDEGAIADEEDEGSDVDDQTEALLKGFESDGDEEENSTEELENGQLIPKLPSVSTKALKKLKKAEQSETSDKPGVVYVGRIPHGFYENEMREYFKQFGTILKLRMSRNPKSGASRHFAFIQFESASVADIVARTMDNYLLFNHILKVKLVPDEQVHEELFKGANKRFKKIPWNKMKGRELELGATEATWEKRIKKEAKRRQDKAAKAKELGYEFQSPKLKSAADVAERPAEQLTLAIEAAPAAPEATKSKRKREKKAEATADAARDTKVTPIASAAVLSAKLKKERKSKAASEVEINVPTLPVAEPETEVRNVGSAEAPVISVADVTHKKLKKKKSKISP